MTPEQPIVDLDVQVGLSSHSSALDTSTTVSHFEDQHSDFKDDMKAVASSSTARDFTGADAAQAMFSTISSQKVTESQFLIVSASLNAYTGGHDLSLVIGQSLEAINLGMTDRASGLLTAIQALIEQLNTDNAVQPNYVTQTLYHCRKLVRQSPPGNRDRFISLFYTAIVAGISYQQSRAVKDLNEEITHLRALLACSQVDDDRVETLEWLARALFDRFQEERRMADLDETSDLLEQALGLRSDGSKRIATLTNLGLVLSTRFDILGRISDLHKAIEYERNALSYIRRNKDLDQQMSSLLSSLGNDLIKRFQQLESQSDRIEAISCHRLALHLRPDGNDLRHRSLLNLGHALLARSQSNKEILPWAIEKAIQLHREALRLCPANQNGRPAHEDRVLCLSSLASSLRYRLEEMGMVGMQIAEEAINHGNEAVALLPEGHPSLVEIRTNLAILYLLQQTDIDCAFYHFQLAAAQETGSTRDRLSAAVEWASRSRSYEDRRELTSKAYSEAMALLNRCLLAYFTVDSQHEFLARPFTQAAFASLACDAASFAIHNNRLEEAVEIIEQGRTFVWSKLRGYRHPLVELREADPKIAEEFELFSAEAERFSVTFHLTSCFIASQEVRIWPGRVPNTTSQARREVEVQWRETLDKIRSTVPGFGDFLEPAPFSYLRNAAAGGPVIILNFSKWRSDALILVSGGPPVIQVPLGRWQDLTGLISRNRSHIDRLQDRARAMRLHDHRVGGDDIFETILGDTWNFIVRPVVEQLPARRSDKLIRIWWCPTGTLGALPIHAAGLCSPCEEENLSSLYISSYTPTLSALISARENYKNRSGSSTPNVLIVGVPGSVGYTPLYGVLQECHVVRGFIPRGKDLIGTDATHAAVFENLPAHPWIHFACHGYHDTMQPIASSRFLLHSDSLTLRDFMIARSPEAELAFLSACDSATSGRDNTPDEVLHLAAAAQFSGFHTVVGTLWWMADIDGMDIAKEFYGFLLCRGTRDVDLTDAAEALHRATRKLQHNGVPPRRWASFIHVGL